MKRKASSKKSKKSPSSAASSSSSQSAASPSHKKLLLSLPNQYISNELLIESAKSGDLKTIKGLLEGENPADIFYLRDNSEVNGTYDNYFHLTRQSALDTAIIHGHFSIVKYLVKNGALRQSDPEGKFQPVELATIYGRLQILKYLIELRAPINNSRSTQLCIAAKEGHLSVLKYFIDELKYSLRPTNEIVLFCAINTAQLNVVKFLVSRNIEITPEHITRAVDVYKNKYWRNKQRFNPPQSYKAVEAFLRTKYIRLY